MIVSLLKAIHKGLKLGKPFVDAATEQSPQQEVQSGFTCVDCGNTLGDLHAADKVGGRCPSCSSQRR